ncbi:hypothetical protein [Burkholderia vietnamiensis]|uniref:hypothetical protein n=1 Tax=Burkholderia vietnamiensis TaxID=60552 RepID=UPI0012DB43B9|nr:hypothetical protein [Burkholderia vietnamiensis]
MNQTGKFVPFSTAEEQASANAFYRDMGALFMNLAGLEAAIRLFLSWQVAGEGQWLADAGDTVPKGPLTDYRSLGGVIADFNEIAAREGLDIRIDPSIVDLRDALAHGRIMMHPDEQFPRLVKFGRPAEGRVPIEINQLLTSDWVGHQVTRVRDAMLGVASVMPGQH